MSTDRFREIHDATATLNAQAAREIREEADRLQRELAASLRRARQHEENDAIVARLHQQTETDTQVPLIERARQASHILGTAPEQPVTPPPAGEGDTAQLPGNLRYNEDRPERRPSTAGANATANATANANATATANVLDVRRWTRLQWVLAVIGLLIGVVVARATYDPMWSNVHNDGWHTLLVLLWFLALMAAGFFTGGWVGSLIDERRVNAPRQH